VAVEDIDEPVSLIACHLAGEFGDVDGVSGASPEPSAPRNRSRSRST